MSELGYVLLAAAIVVFVVVLWAFPGQISSRGTASAAPMPKPEPGPETSPPTGLAATPAVTVASAQAPPAEGPVTLGAPMPSPKRFETASFKPLPSTEPLRSPVVIPVPVAISAVFEPSAIPAVAEMSAAVAVAAPAATKVLPTPDALATPGPPIPTVPDGLQATEVPADPAVEVPAEPEEATPAVPAASEAPSATPTALSGRPTWVSWSPPLPPPVKTPREIRIAGFEVPAPNITMRQGLLIAAGMGLVLAIVRH